MTVQVLVTLNVEAIDPNDKTGCTGEFQAAAVEAVKYAVKYGEANGFCHSLSEFVALEVVSVEHDERNEG
jgi:hypothetical protein